MRGRRREEPIAAHQIVSFRLRKIGISTASSFFDAANAFGSVAHSSITHAIHAKGLPIRHRVGLWQRCKRTTIVAQATDGVCFLRNRTGALQGDSIGGQLFMGPMNAAIIKTDEDLSDVDGFDILKAKCPINEKLVDLSKFVFIDDVLRTFAFNTMGELVHRHSVVNDSFDARVGAIGVQQNRPKQVNMVSPAGPGSNAVLRAFYHRSASGMPNPNNICRYLGPKLSYDGRTNIEIDNRCRATEVGWVSFKAFWTSDNTLRNRAIVFRALVYEAAVSGMTAFVLTQSNVFKLTVKVVKYGRVLLQGRACRRKYENEEPTSYEALSNSEVLRLLWLSPIDVELRVRRLRFWQAVVLEPDNHIQIVAAYFGRFDGELTMFDGGGVILDRAHPWLLQLIGDIEALSIIEDFAHIVPTLASDPRKIFNIEFANDFKNVDVSILRAVRKTCAIPPPGYIAAVPSFAATPAQKEEHVCDIVSGAGVCGATYTTRRALLAHQRSSKAEGHGLRNDVSRFVINNICPWCLSIFASRLVAQRHAVTAFTRDCCPVDRGRIPYPIVEGDYVCHMCDTACADQYEYRDHISTHLPPPSSLEFEFDDHITQPALPLEHQDGQPLRQASHQGRVGRGRSAARRQSAEVAARDRSSVQRGKGSRGGRGRGHGRGRQHLGRGRAARGGRRSSPQERNSECPALRQRVRTQSTPSHELRFEHGHASSSVQDVEADAQDQERVLRGRGRPRGRGGTHGRQPRPLDVDGSHLIDNHARGRGGRSARGGRRGSRHAQDRH